MNINRRQSIFAGGAAASTALIPGRVLGANEKVNLAAIGLGQQGGGITGAFAGNPNVNLIALCDVDIDSSSPIKDNATGQLGWGKAAVTPAHNAAKYPNAKKYRDFRKMFDEMGNQIDAVCIGVPDHSHFPITMHAMSLGIDVFVEKPLARTFQECDLLMKAEKKYGVVTQMGNQGHSGDNYYQFKAWREAGIIKDVYHVDAYMNNWRRWHPWGDVTGYPTGGSVPPGMNWKVWQGTTPFPVEFSDKLHYGNWRGWHQFGTGCFGDWGAHILDTIHEFLDLGLPSTFGTKMIEGRNDYIFPMKSVINFAFPDRGEGLPAMDIDWYDGQENWVPKPKEMGDRNIGGPGKFIYSKELIFHGNSHHNPLQVIPYDRFRQMLIDGTISKDYGKHSNHYENFINSVRGIETTNSPFSVAGPLCQMFALGCIAQRLGGQFEFDRKTQQITNNKTANAYLKDNVRKGWEQYYKV